MSCITNYVYNDTKDIQPNCCTSQKDFLVYYRRDKISATNILEKLESIFNLSWSGDYLSLVPIAIMVPQILLGQLDTRVISLIPSTCLVSSIFQKVAASQSKNLAHISVETFNYDDINAEDIQKPTIRPSNHCPCIDGRSNKKGAVSCAIAAKSKT